MHGFDPPVLDRLKRLIERAVAAYRHTLSSSGLPGLASEDLSQELWAEVIAKLPRFNPRRASLETFVKLLIDRHVIRLARRYAAKRRGPAWHVSLSERHPDGVGGTVTLAETAVPNELGPATPDDFAAVDAREELDLLLARLPDRERAVVERWLRAEKGDGPPLDCRQKRKFRDLCRTLAHQFGIGTPATTKPSGSKKIRAPRRHLSPRSRK